MARSIKRILAKNNLNRRTGAAPRILTLFINAKPGKCTIPLGRPTDELERELEKGIAEKNSEMSSLKHQPIYDVVASHMHKKYGWPIR